MSNTLTAKVMGNRLTAMVNGRAAMALLGTVFALLLLTGTAHAEFGVTPGTFRADTNDPVAGGPDTRAGAHPAEFVTAFSLNLLPGPNSEPDGSLRDVSVALPEGLSGNPEAVPKCARDTFDAVVNNDGTTRCPVASQVGIAEIGFWYGTSATVAVLNIEPRPGDVADFGFVIVSTPVHIIPTLDPASNYALKASLNKVPQVLPIVSSRVTLWGVPSDPSHDPQRICAGQPYIQGPCSIKDVTPQAFLTNPSSCMGPQRSRVTIASWQGPNALASADYTTAAGITGCDQLRFEPSSGVRTTTERGDAPTGLAVDLAFPQTTDPAGFGSPPLRTATVALPEGLTINPGSADGLQACSDAQLGLKSDAPIGCPEAAKIGTATVHTPVLSELLTGTVYLRTQNSDDPESGEMFRLALLLKSEARGLLIKLPGTVRANKDTGRLTAVFADNPQLPVSSISLELKSGPRAPLATPPACGPHNVQTTLASWAEQSVTADATINVACTPELGRFAPTFSAGSVNPVAGASSSFGLSIVKPDGNAAVNGLTMTLPTGLLARLKGNLNTQVGSVTAYAGPGTNPFALPGKVFLEGQYGDAPFSLRAVVPAKAGPFDLGEVVVRQKIYVDPIDGHVTVVSDPIPTIVKGVPVRLQRLDVNVDKPGFMLNPTSCVAKSIEGALGSVAGTTAALSVRFQVGSCADLALKPSLGLTLSGKGQTTDGKHPAVTAALTQPAGQANLKKVRVALPLSLALDPDNANGLCEFVDGSKATPTCPKASIVGTATAVTSILDEPLSGPVYFVKNIRKDSKSGREIRTLPKLVIPLVGQNGLKLTLTGTSAVESDQLVTTFDNIPDAPVSSFKLNINGGKGGILVVSGDKADICKSTQMADQQVDGQNNKSADADVFIQTPSCALKVVSKKVTAKAVTLKVGGLGAGTVTVTGKGIKKTSKSISKSTVATIVVRRTKGKPGKVKVSFVPAGAKKAKTVTA